MFYTIFEAEKCTVLFDWTSLLALIPLIPCVIFAWEPLEELVKGGFSALKKRKSYFVMLGIALFFLIITLYVPYANLSHNSALREYYDRYKAGDCAYVEGVITDFHPMPEEGHDVESFTVNGVYFAYGGDLSSTYYYNLCQKDGGQLKDGREVRIWYFPDDLGGTIMCIDVKV